MKRILLIITGLSLFLPSCRLIPDAISGASKVYNKNGNSLYHQTDDINLEVGELFVDGEVKSPGKVKLKDYYKREVFYKQAIPSKEEEVDFAGAYRYRGYSLFDILNPFILAKKNAETFRPAMDVYVIVENDKGESVVFSWSEIFHTNILHQVILATEMAPVKPYKVEVNYPVGKVWKVVAANDLFAFRELENPTRIIVKSFDKKDYAINKELRNATSLKVDVVLNNQLAMTIDTIISRKELTCYNSIFYGMGMGYHHSPEFRGIELQSIIQKCSIDDYSLWNKKGLLCFAGIDGYRVICSFGELFNRVDQVKPILAIPNKNDESGYYRLYNPSDFYADRSAKGLAEIYLFME